MPLREHDTTTVSAELFDALLAALDTPARPNPALARAAQQTREALSRD